MRHGRQEVSRCAATPYYRRNRRGGLAEDPVMEGSHLCGWIPDRQQATTTAKFQLHMELHSRFSAYLAAIAIGDDCSSTCQFTKTKVLVTIAGERKEVHRLLVIVKEWISFSAKR